MKKFVCLGALLFAPIALAHNVQLNQVLNPVSINQGGEITLTGGKVQYKNWQSAELTGKVRIVQHIAGRSEAKEKNQGLIQAIKKANFDRSRYQTTTIINSDDAMVGTGLFVKSSAEKGKKENPHSQVILDEKGKAKNAWQLKSKESFIAVLDKQGKVQFVAEGKLNNAQIEQVIKLVSSLL